MASNRDRLVKRFVNKTTGSDRKGEKFKVVTKGGVRYHDYGGGRLIADKSGPPKARQPAAERRRRPLRRSRRRAPGRSAPAGSGSPAGRAPPRPGSPRPRPTGCARTRPAPAPRLNIAANNPRQGQRFSVVTRGDKTLHKYAPGRVFTGQAAGPGSVAYRKPKRKPPLPPGARTERLRFDELEPAMRPATTRSKRWQAHDGRGRATRAGWASRATCAPGRPGLSRRRPSVKKAMREAALSYKQWISGCRNA